MSQILQPYEVSLTHNDISIDETYQDVVHSLLQLSKTINDIYNRIDKRIDNEKERLNVINNRIAICNSKVLLVRGSNKATTVFSTSKFPSSKSLPLYPTLFTQVSENPDVYRPIDDDVQYFAANPKDSPLYHKELMNEVQNLLSRFNTVGTDMDRIEMIMEEKGLGSLPYSIESVGSLLLFNSDINPYKNYQTLDNLLSAGKSREDKVSGSRVLASAPTTLLTGDALPDIDVPDISFKPELGQLSSLALPSNLPLDFLADIQYSGDALPSIAPSSQSMKPNYSLPQITDGGMSFTYEPSVKQSQQQPPSVPTVASNPPPPPPPSSLSSQSDIPSFNPPSLATPPPPPPPPVVSQLPPPIPVINQLPPPPPPPLDNDESGTISDAPRRASFLDDIKGMSVNRLRSKEEANVAAAKVKKEEVAKKPVSMSDELRLRMQRRNNALAGRDDKEKRRNDSIIVQQAQQQAEMAQQTKSQGRPPQPPPPPPPHKPAIQSLFATVENDDNDSDREIRLPTRNRDTDSSDDSESVISEISIASIGLNTSNNDNIASATSTTSVAQKMPSIPIPPMPRPRDDDSDSDSDDDKKPITQHRGSLLDPSNKTLAQMLTVAKQKEEKSDSDDDDGWG